MLVVIDLMGNEETIVVGDTDADQAEKKRRHEQALREIAERTPQPDLQIVPVTPTK